MLHFSPASSPTASPACLLSAQEMAFPPSFGQLREQVVAITGTPLHLSDSVPVGGGVTDQRLPAAVSGVATVSNDALTHVHAQIMSVDFQGATAQGEQASARGSASWVNSTVPAMLSGALRIGFATAAGRTASWMVKELLPAELGAAAMPLAIAGCAIRSAATTGLCLTAAQSILSTRPRMAARAAAALCGGLMMLPVAATYAAPSAGLAGAIALGGLSDMAYVLVRDPLQSCLRNAGPRVTLTRADGDPAPHWPALSAAGVCYGLSAASWMLLFAQHVAPLVCEAGAMACNALETIVPAAAIEATEAASSTAVFSFFRGAGYRQDFAIETPQPQAIAITAAMRLFATGILQLADLAMRVFFHSPGGIPFGICFLVMMSLEWVGGLAQQALSHVSRSRRDATEDLEHPSLTTQTTRL